MLLLFNCDPVTLTFASSPGTGQTVTHNSPFFFLSGDLEHRQYSLRLGSLVKYTKVAYPRTVTHSSTNRARRRATTLIKTNALPLSQQQPPEWNRKLIGGAGTTLLCVQSYFNHRDNRLLPAPTSPVVCRTLLLCREHSRDRHRMFCCSTVRVHAVLLRLRCCQLRLWTYSTTSSCISKSMRPKGLPLGAIGTNELIIRCPGWLTLCEYVP